MCTRVVRVGVVAAAVLAGTVALPASAVSRPPVEIVSVSTGGVLANGFSLDEPAVSADGKYVAFVSPATNLVPGDTNGASDVFVRDLTRGLTRRASLDTAGQESNGASRRNPALSKDGRWVAFASNASNLVAGDTNDRADVFVRDLRYGITERVSLASDGAQLDDGHGSFNRGISADGRYVLFSTDAAAVPEDTNQIDDIYVRDLKKGTTRRVSVASDGAQANSHTLIAAISGNGRYVAFMSYATNLVPGDTNGTSDVFRHDLKTGKTIRVSVGPGGRQGTGSVPGGLGSNSASISHDGRVVAFGSSADGLVDQPHGIGNIYVRDVAAGTTELVSVGLGGTAASGLSVLPHVSGDGRYVAFYSDAVNLVAGDTNGQGDGFVRDLKKDLTRRVTLGAAGQQGDRFSGYSVLLDGDGDTAVFASNATNLVAGDTNGQQDVFVARLKK